MERSYAVGSWARGRSSPMEEALEQASPLPADARLRTNVDTLLKYSHALSSQKQLLKKLPSGAAVPRPMQDKGLPVLPPTLPVSTAPAPSPPSLGSPDGAEEDWEQRLHNGLQQLIHLALSLKTSLGTKGSSLDSGSKLDPGSKPSSAKKEVQETAPRGRIPFAACPRHSTGRCVEGTPSLASMQATAASAAL
ncbi:uncharacterized protein FYN16_014760 isoform 1-T1 [Cariama cristata]